MKFFRKLKQKYDALPLLSKAAFWFTVCSFMQQGISYVITPFITRLLTADEYGVWNVYQTWASIISIFTTINLAAGGFVNALIKNKEKQNSLVSSIVVLGFALTLFWVGIYFAAKPFFDLFINLAPQYVVVLMFEAFFKLVFSLWATQQRYNLKYRFLVFITVFSTIVTQAISLLCVYFMDNKLDVRIYTSAGIPSLIYFVLMVWLFIKGKCFFNKEYWKYMLLFNIPLVPHYLSQIILNQSDRIMIDSICGSNFTAYYSVAYAVGNLILLLVSSIMSAVSPWMLERFDRDEKVKTVSNYLSLFFALAILIPILIGPELIRLFAPEEYYQAIWVIPPVSCSVYFAFLYTLFSSYQFFKEKKLFVALSSIVVAGINIGLNYIFINLYGFIAAGYTTLFCYVLYSIIVFLYTYYLNKKSGKGNIFSYLFLFIVGLISIAISLASNLLYRNDLVRYIVLGVFVALIIVSIPFVKKRIPLGKKEEQIEQE